MKGKGERTDNGLYCIHTDNAHCFEGAENCMMFCFWDVIHI